MNPHSFICGCLLVIVFAGIWNTSSDIQAREYNPEEHKKHVCESGVNAEDRQSRDERLETLEAKEMVSM